MREDWKKETLIQWEKEEIPPYPRVTAEGMEDYSNEAVTEAVSGRVRILKAP